MIDRERNRLIFINGSIYKWSILMAQMQKEFVRLINSAFERIKVYIALLYAYIILHALLTSWSYHASAFPHSPANQSKWSHMLLLTQISEDIVEGPVWGPVCSLLHTRANRLARFIMIVREKEHVPCLIPEEYSQCFSLIVQVWMVLSVIALVFSNSLKN